MPDARGLGTRATTVAIAALILAAVVLPRSTPVLLALLGLAALGGLLVRRQTIVTIDPRDGLVIAAGLFLSWSAISSLWTPQPLQSAGKVGLMAVLGIMAACFVRGMWSESGAQRRAVAHGLVSGLLLAGLLLALELISGQWIAQTVYNAFPALKAAQIKHLIIENGAVSGISDADVNRRVYVWTFLLVPALAWLGRAGAGSGERSIALALAGLACVIVAVSTHQSSQLFLLSAAATLLVWRLSAAWGHGLLATAFAAGVLLTVPVALAAYGQGLHRAEWLFESARHRVIIWGYTSELALADPWRGVGVDATAAIDAARPKATLEQPADHFRPRRTGRHAHNVFIQLWYELGVIGALTALTAGLLLISRLRGIRPHQDAYGAALLAGIVASLATSYSIWQPWIIALIGLSFAFMQAAIAAASPAAVALNTKITAPAPTDRPVRRGQGA